MQKAFPLFLSFVLSIQLSYCQVETFEDETDNTMIFTETTTGATFQVTNNFEVQIGGPFGAGGSNGWLDSQAGNPVTGIVGEIQVTGTTTSFILSQLEVWTSANNAGSEAAGTVTFRGTPIGGGSPLVETVFINPPNISTYDIVNFTGALAGAQITALEIDLTGSGLNYIGLDNLVFNQIILPVELISFEAQNKTESIGLRWTTLSEINNDKFEIESSLNGRDFQKIGEVKGKGTTHTKNEYSFNYINPSDGINYFRLRQIDFDGHSEYSKVESINFQKAVSQIGEFYPNPSSSGLVSINYDSERQEEIQICIYDMSGNLIMSQNQFVSNGSNKLELDWSSLNGNMFIVKFGQYSNPVYRKVIIR